MNWNRAEFLNCCLKCYRKNKLSIKRRKGRNRKEPPFFNGQNLPQAAGPPGPGIYTAAARPCDIDTCNTQPTREGGVGND